MGGLSHVVQNVIDHILDHIRTARVSQLESLRTAFIPWLATVNPDNDQPMRRVARWSDLPEASRGLIDAFVANRLMVKDKRDGEDVVEVSLESLLRQWDDLAGWLDDERANLKTAADLERAAIAWRANGCKPDWLLPGGRLAAAQSLVARPAFARLLAHTYDFLTASRRAVTQPTRHAGQENLRGTDSVSRERRAFS